MAALTVAAATSACGDDTTSGDGDDSGSSSSEGDDDSASASITVADSSSSSTDATSTTLDTSTTDPSGPDSSGTDTSGESSGSSSESSSDDEKMDEGSSSDGGTPQVCPYGALGPAIPDSIFGNTYGATDDYTGSCGGAGAPDAEYTFTAPADGSYTFDTHGSQLDTILYVLDDECTGTELACNDNGDGSQSALAIDLVAGQTITLVVDGHDDDGLPFALRVQTGAIVCPNADIGSTVPNTIAGDTTELFDGSSASCGGQAGRDAHYLFTAPSAATYSFETFGSSFESVIYVRDGVCGGNELVCGSEGALVDLASGQQVTVTVDSQYAWGEFDLHVAGLGGACPDADLGSALPVSTVGDTTDGDNTDGGSCGGSFSNDHLYLFTAPQGGLYQFDTFGSTLDTVLYVLDGCQGAELGCNDDFDPMDGDSRVIAGLAGGQDVIVGVDGNGAGAYDLTIDLVPCPDDALDSLAVQTVFGDTTGGINKLTGSCQTSGESSDFAYSFTAPQDGEYVFDTFGSSFNTVLYVLDGAACNGTEIACSDNFTNSQQSALSVQLTQGETVTVVVDGNFDAEGSFQLNASQLGGGACPDIDLGNTVPQSVMGDTSGADNTVAATCGGFTTGDDTYSFTAPLDGLYVFNTLGSSYDTVLFLRDGDCGGAELACNDNNGFISLQSQVSYTLAADQSVIVGVDGVMGTGAYTLNVQYVTCPDLDIDNEYPSMQFGSTAGSVDKIQSVGCFGSDGGSPDYVVEWTAPADGNYVFDLMGSDYDTFLIVQDVACGGAELACNDDTFGLLSQVNVNLVEDQTVMIAVSGFSGDTGNFQLNIN